MTQADQTLAPAQFSVSDAAARRIAEIIAKRGDDAAQTALRVAVSAGGCNGFQYEFRIDPEIAADDVVIEKQGVRVTVDPASLDLLAGAELDFTDKLMGAHFSVKNPNAATSCGCGTSFSLAG
ncbi:iron-sulfur cluster assembly protein HesB/YadR/YfhF [Acetobacter nitrogenifigens DSM 23921 = NBRC 105050]|uniref:Heme biosynthesis protein HemY n=1 Tax=Acetobacter nitrogenifigens DSM 23921 = NBRC 105050 TaxID=1120919 RepID=A0A511XCX8_9PROT|nr:iron-sulfur cluster insertion protein ErpA [Acetobacter nitrogenifigens]GBQ87807.1 iron-sulfur cluster assembly protein HesB/YadR/YfhF [Acetobacter nitrogenifigens DSM 23921 = NBRC 105050]GEN60725.1 heme biosynthesis protein HemY [Acetobacter nitrogenifigens DSM 23921 = NBRC 105050]